MRKIIKNKRYDTETAEMIGDYDNGFLPNDFNYINEELYKKRTGEYFLYGEGGAMSRYASQAGENWGYGEEIIPMTFESAREWAEKHLDADDYEKEFGEVSEGDEQKKYITVYVTNAAADKLTRLASESGKSRSQIVNDMIMDK